MDKKKTEIPGYCKNDKVMFVCISSSFQGKHGFESRKDKPYECTQKYWELKGENLRKAEEADYICGTSKCTIKGIYKNTSGWKRVREFEDMKNELEVVTHPDYLDRYAFEGEDVPEETRRRYIGQRIPEPCKHGQNRVVSFNF